MTIQVHCDVEQPNIAQARPRKLELFNPMALTCVTMPSAWPRGTMVALWMGEAPGVCSATMAWPAS